MTIYGDDRDFQGLVDRPEPEKCEACNGTGLHKGHGTITTHDGHGCEVSNDEQPCQECEGTGEVVPTLSELRDRREDAAAQDDMDRNQ